MKEKILNDLKDFLSKSLEHIYTDSEKNMYVPIFAQVIHEGALKWAAENNAMDKEKVAKNVALFVVGGSQLV